MVCLSESWSLTFCSTQSSGHVHYLVLINNAIVTDNRVFSMKLCWRLGSSSLGHLTCLGNAMILRSSHGFAQFDLASAPMVYYSIHRSVPKNLFILDPLYCFCDYMTQAILFPKLSVDRKLSLGLRKNESTWWAQGRSCNLFEAMGEGSVQTLTCLFFIFFLE